MCSIIRGVVFLSLGLLWIIRLHFNSSMKTFLKTRWKFASTWIVLAQISTSNSSRCVAFKLKYSKNITFKIPIPHFHPLYSLYIIQKRTKCPFVVFQNMCSFMPLLRGSLCNRIVTSWIQIRLWRFPTLPYMHDLRCVCKDEVGTNKYCMFFSLLSLSQILLWFRLVCIVKTSVVILIVLSARPWLSTCLCSFLRPHSDVHLFRSRPCCDWWSGCCHCLHHALSPHRPRQIPHQTQRYCTLTHHPNQTKKSLALFHTHAQI